MGDSLVSRVSGRRLNRMVDYFCQKPDFSKAVISMTQKPVRNEFGDISVQNVPSFVGPDFCAVPACDASEFSVASILKNGNLPNLVATAGAFDPIAAQQEGKVIAGQLDSELSKLQNVENDATE